jgi:hypothetical protein
MPRLYDVSTGILLKRACRIETSRLMRRIFRIYTVQWTVLCSKQQLSLTSAVIFGDDAWIMWKFTLFSLRLRSLKVDVQLNKNRKQDVSGVHLPACIKHNKYLEAMLALYDYCMSMPWLDMRFNPCACLQNANTIHVKDLFFRYL